jgi:hypothetical protein
MRVTFLQHQPAFCFAMSLDFQNQSSALTSDALGNVMATPCAAVASSAVPGRAASGRPVWRFDESVTDEDLLVGVTGLPGVTDVTYLDAVRLVHNLREAEAPTLQVQWLLEVLEGAFDRLHPGPMLANPFVLIRVSLAVKDAKGALRRASRCGRPQTGKPSNLKSSI